jgi:hypothetical protein
MIKSFRKTYPIRNCLQCGAILVRREGQPASNFKKQKFCNHKCCGIYQQKVNATQPALCRRAFIYKKEKCESCGASEHLCVHHIDGNEANNIPENIRTLCLSCHNKLHRLQGDIVNKEAASCSICGNKNTRNGLCPKHYARYKKTGSPNAIMKRVENPNNLKEYKFVMTEVNK